MACRCTSVSPSRQRRTRSASRLASTASATSSCGVWTSAVLCSRSAAAVVERTRSMARRWAIVITHVAAPPTAGSNRAAVRHTSRRTSWVTSSDWDGSRRTRRITPYTGPASRSYTASNASVSPRATWTSRRSRSRSPLLSVVADVNLDAPESFGFICHLRSQRRIGWVEHGRILRNLTGSGLPQRGAEPEYPHKWFLLPCFYAAWRAHRRAAAADITKAWRVTARSRLPAREYGGGHARGLGAALRVAAHRRPRRRAAALLLRRLVGELRRRGHDRDDHLVRPGQLLRRQSEAHVSLAGSSGRGRGSSGRGFPGGGSMGGGCSGRRSPAVWAGRASRVDAAARIALRPAPRGTLR